MSGYRSEGADQIRACANHAYVLEDGETCPGYKEGSGVCTGGREYVALDRCGRYLSAEGRWVDYDSEESILERILNWARR